jgi:phage terminase large subunit-like protein
VTPTHDDLVRYRRSPLEFCKAILLPTAGGIRRFGEVMAGFQRERFEWLCPDMAALAEKRRPPVGRHWWEATKGASKDTDLGMMAIWLLAFSTRPIYGQIGAADKDQAAELRRAVTGILYANPWIRERVVTDRFKILRQDATGEIEILAADPTGSHGARPDLMILNELHAIAAGGRTFAENLMDNAAKMAGYGVTVIATNAGFKNTWQWTWREYARKHPERWFFHRYSDPAPWLSKTDLDEARVRNSRTRYQRLWQGLWVSATGDAIEVEDIEAAVTMEEGHTVGREGWVYGAGLDLGVKRDHSAMVVLGTQPGSGRVAVVKVRSWRPGSGGSVDLMAVKEEVKATSERFQLMGVFYDPHQAALMSQELEADGVPMVEVVFYGQTLNRMASSLIQAFKSRTIDLYREEELLEDLGRLTLSERNFGYKLTAVSDEAGHADRAVAMSIALPVMMEMAGAEVLPAMPAMPSMAVAV